MKVTKPDKQRKIRELGFWKLDFLGEDMNFMGAEFHGKTAGLGSSGFLRELLG
jgi:hypothetical protein